MRIDEFVEQMAVRFDTKLATPAQIEAFRQDCLDELKPYQGEILGYAYHQIKGDAKHRTHPTIGQIRKVCSEKASDKHFETNSRSPEQDNWQKIKMAVSRFKLTDQYSWCCQRMIGADVLLHIERTGEIPTRPEIDAMLNARQRFKAEMENMANDHDISDLRLALYKMGQGVEEKNLTALEGLK